MKKSVSLILTFIMIISVSVLLSGCGQTASRELEFTSNGDGTCVLSGIGLCDDITVVVPDKSPDGDTVVSVAQSAFRNVPNLTVITLPDTVTEIEEYAFADNQKLIRVDLPSKLEKIGDGAFENCTQMTDMTLPETLVTVGNAFSGCTSLTAVTLNAEFKYALLEPVTDTQDYAVTVSKEPITKPSDNGFYMEITDENRNDILCRLFGKETLKINGEDVTFTGGL